MTKPKIKIFVTYKDKHRVLKSDIIEPIQTGRAIAPKIFHEMIGDDTGENISHLNPLFSELSALYWIWKNYETAGNPDYIGHMHYRRQFLFETSNLRLNKKWISSYYKFKTFSHSLLNAFSDENIQKIVPQYDYLIPAWHHVKKTNRPIQTIRDEYIQTIPGAKAEIFDKFIEICKKRIPQYSEEIEKIENGNIVLVCNMFIMKKELFFDFCELAFPILNELIAEINETNLTTNGKRFAGYMAEKLLSMYVMKLEKNKNLKEKFLTCSYIEYPDKYLLKTILKNFFSIKNDSNNHKKITILGLKIKLKRGNNAQN